MAASLATMLRKLELEIRSISACATLSQLVRQGRWTHHVRCFFVPLTHRPDVCGWFGRWGRLGLRHLGVSLVCGRGAKLAHIVGCQLQEHLAVNRVVHEG